VTTLLEGMAGTEVALLVDPPALVFDAEPDPRAVRLGMDPYVLMRPEGRWDRPGILDQSAQRSARKPAAQKKRA